MNILVTGASRGIGKTIAETLDGNIFVSARSEDLLKQYRNYCVCDLASEAEKLGRYIQDSQIDVLINNAGEYIYSPVENITKSELEHIIKVNLEAPLYLISKAVPYMKSKNGGG